MTKLVAHRPTVSFIVLAYALAWACWLPPLADRQNWVSWSASPYLHLLGALGPAAAALIVTTAVHGTRGVRRSLAACVAWRGRLGLLTLAAIGPLVLFAVAVVAARVIEGRWPALDRFGATSEYPAVPIVLYWAANLVRYGPGPQWSPSEATLVRPDVPPASGAVRVDVGIRQSAR